MKKCFLMVATALFSSGLLAQQEILCYPDGADESNNLQEIIEREGEYKRSVSEAKMYAFFAADRQNSRAAVLICPGGGYSGISFVKEGNEIAQWFNSLGINAFVLHYRMPNGNYNIPLKDLQTAFEIIQKNSKKWNIDRHKIGIMGFSAGGHLAATAGTHLRSQPCKPAFMLLVYPVITMDSLLTHSGSRENLIGKTPSDTLVAQFSAELNVTNKTPKTFIVAAEDDGTVPIKNSELFYDALKNKKVPVEFVRLQNGGHGFGMRKTGAKSDNWELFLEKWLIENDFVKK
ncbi:MAG: alpha/beta hydrolase [Prevotellaceae bacterium]|jgi:acetyl esterase/lipase|nr:alpha/beta hydrolase [Prevotellaceae bacterium]